MSPQPVVRRVDPESLSDEVVASILDAARLSEQADGARPLSEQCELRLRHRSQVHHLLVTAEERVIGYAQLAPSPQDDATVEAEGFIVPSSRRQGNGRGLLRVAMATIPAGTTVLVWAHGDAPAAARLAEQVGARRTRELLQMSRDASAVAQPSSPQGVTLRTFRPGEDEQEWLNVNAAAFADHPEQGAWTMADLQARMAEPWFDPQGLIIAEDAGGIAGFHWTKIERHAGTAVGEVYVVGIAPRAQGRGLGRVLTAAGINHMTQARVDVIELYADADNRAAVRLYDSMGFTVATVDVQYTWQPEPESVTTLPH